MDTLKMLNLLKKLNRNKKRSLAAGAAVAPVGAFSSDIVGRISAGLESAPMVPQILALSFAENVLGGAVGFFMGVIITACWQMTQSE